MKYKEWLQVNNGVIQHMSSLIKKFNYLILSLAFFCKL